MDKQIKVSLFVGVILVLMYNLSTFQNDSITDEYVEDMIKRENYSVETHTIETEDGYFLSIHRIPGPSGSIPVYIQHGVFVSSADWLKNGKNGSLPYILADNGYDVWLGNARGNTYSRKHKTISTTNPQFWNFSWHEQGIYDIPASILYISKLTNNSIYYVGYSMGGSSFSVMATQRPNIAKNVRAMVGLSPAVYEYHIKQPLLRILSKYSEQVQAILNTLGINEMFPQRVFFNIFTNICKIPGIGSTIGSRILFFLMGYNPEQLNYEKLSIYWNNLPAGTSVKVFSHWLQQMNVNEFRNFDYGLETNLKIYGTSQPPIYDLTKIEVPVAVFTSKDDLIVPAEDVSHFYNQIPHKLGLYDVGHSFSHTDFLWAINATDLVYNKIIDIFQNLESTVNEKSSFTDR